MDHHQALLPKPNDFSKTKKVSDVAHLIYAENYAKNLDVN